MMSGPSTPPAPTLTLSGGTRLTKSLRVGQAFAIGSSRAADFRIPHPSITPRHAVFTWDGNATRVEDAEPAGHQQTADLLEALRRRRGERDPMDPPPSDAMAAHPSTGSIRLIDIPLEGDGPGARVPGDQPTGSQPTAPQPGAGRNGTGPLGKRKGRASMPSWDEIVFGARPDDDLG